MIQVAVAVIIDTQQRVLVAQRPLHTSHGGCWEFPGGKLEANEPPEQALIREVKEEVSLDVLGYKFLGEVKHQYTEKTVHLLVYLVTEFSGTPRPAEGQPALEWVPLNQLNPADFPEANHKVMALIPVLNRQLAKV